MTVQKRQPVTPQTPPRHSSSLLFDESNGFKHSAHRWCPNTNPRNITHSEAVPSSHPSVGRYTSRSEAARKGRPLLRRFSGIPAKHGHAPLRDRNLLPWFPVIVLNLKYLQRTWWALDHSVKWLTQCNRLLFGWKKCKSKSISRYSESNLPAVTLRW